MAGCVFRRHALYSAAYGHGGAFFRVGSVFPMLKLISNGKNVALRTLIRLFAEARTSWWCFSMILRRIMDGVNRKKTRELAWCMAT